MDGRKSHRRPASSLGGLQILSILFVLGVIAAGLYVTSHAAKEEAAAQDAEPEETVDPFADLPEEMPRSVASVKRANSEGDFLADLARDLDEEVWNEAQAMAKEAEELIAAAVRAKDAGDSATAREKGSRAQELLRQAVETTREWQLGLAADRGWEDTLVKAVSRMRSEWNREIMALKKTAGL